MLTAVTKKMDPKKYPTVSATHSTTSSATPYAVGSATATRAYAAAGGSVSKSSGVAALRGIAAGGESGVVRSPGTTTSQTHLTHFSIQRRITVESPAPDVPLPPFTSISSYASASATSSVASMATSVFSTHSSRTPLNAATTSVSGGGSAIPVRNERRRSRSGNAVLGECRDSSSKYTPVSQSGPALKSVVSSASVQLRGSLRSGPSVGSPSTGQYIHVGRSPLLSNSSSGVTSNENAAPSLHSGSSSSTGGGAYTKSVSALPVPRLTSRYTAAVEGSKGVLRPI